MPDYKTYELPTPFWQILRDQAPQRAKAVEERIKELEAQRELIDIEISMYRAEQGPSLRPPVSLQGPRGWEASLSGFHNPKRHHGLSAAEFLDLYKRRLAQKGSPYHQKLLTWVEQHESDVLQFITKRFRRTLTNLNN